MRHNAMVSIIASAFTAVSKDVVCRGDVGEAGGCAGVVAVAIGVVREGEGVKLSSKFGS